MRQRLYNEYFSHYEQIKKFILLGNSWSPDGGELTATLKLKRRNILEKYSDLYLKIFAIDLIKSFLMSKRLLHSGHLESNEIYSV